MQGFSFPFDGYYPPTDDDLHENDEYVFTPYSLEEQMQRYLIQFDDDKSYTFCDEIPS